MTCKTMKSVSATKSKRSIVEAHFPLPTFLLWRTGLLTEHPLRYPRIFNQGPTSAAPQPSATNAGTALTATTAAVTATIAKKRNHAVVMTAHIGDLSITSRRACVYPEQ